MQIQKIALLFLLTFMLFISCDKKEVGAEALLQGSYVGTLTPVNSEIQTTQPAVADVKVVGNHLLEIHCYSEEFDTIVRLNYFHHNEQYMVCATGQDFENMYGHALSGQHMSQGRMMNESEWMYHLRREHSESDEHFGQFGGMDHSFEYIFMFENDELPYNLKFLGMKK